MKKMSKNISNLIAVFYPELRLPSFANIPTLALHQNATKSCISKFQVAIQASQCDMHIKFSRITIFFIF